MEKDKLEPKLRFPGFTEPWEQRKFGDRMYIKARVGWQALTKSEYLVEGDYYLITGTDIDPNHTVDLSRSYYVSKQRYELDSNIQLVAGDIIITKDGTIGKVALIRELDKPATLNSHLFLVRDKSGELDNCFLLQTLLSPRFVNFVKSVKTGSTLTGLPLKTILNFSFRKPGMEEQRSISFLLNNLDRLITLHQRKEEELQKLKKGLLQKMFPKDGESVPEVRFPNFTNTWEQRKVGEFTKFHKQGFYTTQTYDQNKSYYLLRGTDLANNRLLIKDTPKIDVSEEDYQSFRVLPGDFLFVRSGNIGTYAIVYHPIKAMFGSYLINFRFDNQIILNEFFGYFYETDLAKKQLNSKMQKSANMNVNAENIKRIIVNVPEKREQSRIAGFFQNVDELITLHHRKTEELKKLKKALLQQMFV